MDEKVVIIGAGSAMFTQGVVSDLIRMGINAELALVDIDPVALDTVFKLVGKMIAYKKTKITLTASLDRKKILPDATIVITTIGVGKRRAWEQDIFIPRKYGLFYPVGDTVGPGGTSRALRMIPAMIDIAHDVLDLAPNALFFNYANPMAVICHAVRKATGANMIGLCIGTHDTIKYLGKALNEPFENLTVSAGGINHLTWFSGLWANGEDMMPRLKKIATQKVGATKLLLEKIKLNKAIMPHASSFYTSSFDFPFSWQSLLWFGAFPSPEDRHVCEFFPQFFREGKYYDKILGVNEFSFEETILHGDNTYENMKKDAESVSPLDESYFEKIQGEQEQALQILLAIRENKTQKFFANLPNDGQVPNLPHGVIVETPVITDGNGIHAIVQKPLPVAAKGVLSTRYQWVDMVVDAALECSREKFITSLILDGGVRTPDEAVLLANELLEAQKAYLPGFKL